jgi:hypothetical protein
MQKNRMITALSAAGLASAILVWFELFAFAKIVYMPAWAALLPSAFLAPCVIALPCLVPAALFTTSIRAGVRSLLWVVLLAPMPALVVYAANPVHQHSGLLLNLAFQYVWIVGSGLLLPASGLLGVRAILKSMASWLTNARRRRAKTHAPQA